MWSTGLLPELPGGPPLVVRPRDGNPSQEEFLTAVRERRGWVHLVLLANLRIAHGRLPFTGPRRVLTVLIDRVVENGDAG